MFIEGIIERLNNINLKNKNNQFRKVLDGTIGEWLEHYLNHFFNLFVSRAKNEYLDLLGKEMEVIRKTDESDNDYRKRILTEMNITNSTKDLTSIGVRLWVYDENVLNELDYLTSRNPYLKQDSDKMFLGHSNNDTKEYIQNKFITTGIIWF